MSYYNKSHSIKISEWAYFTNSAMISEKELQKLKAVGAWETVILASLSYYSQRETRWMLLLERVNLRIRFFLIYHSMGTST